MKRRALLSVTDKSGIVEFARALVRLDFEIISTGGTSAALESGGIRTVDVGELTSFPELFDGRVKTLHPAVFGGLLFDRNNPSHCSQAEDNSIRAIDLVCVNLYDFKKNAQAANIALSEAIKFIDIGGPSLLRAAAKNFASCLSICDPRDYDAVIQTLESQDKRTLIELAQTLAAKVFEQLSGYDAMIANYFNQMAASEISSDQRYVFYQSGPVKTLRYGENPAQKSQLIASDNSKSRESFALKKDLSFNNTIDSDAAYKLISRFDPKTAKSVAIIKHNNPCAVASLNPSKAMREVFLEALSCDKKSAFGGVIAMNGPLDSETAKEICKDFFEVIVCTKCDSTVLDIVQKTKPSMRVVVMTHDPFADTALWSDVRRLSDGSLLVQNGLKLSDTDSDWRVVTQKKPLDSELRDLRFGEIVVAHVKSNAIVLVRDGKTLSIGAGQMSRIDSLEFAVYKAKKQGVDLRGSILASDAFFPFRDCVDLAAEAGVSAIVQPGGSVRDQESVDACNQHGIAMVVHNHRGFFH